MRNQNPIDRVVHLYEFTMLLSERAHENQTYDEGTYFANHILPVVRKSQEISDSVSFLAPNIPHTIDVCSLAYLHDAVEDNVSVNRDFLERCGYPDYFINQIELLTKLNNQTYREYVDFICESNSISAKIVKLADNECNLAAANGIKDEAKRARLVKRWIESREKVYEALCLATDNKLTYKI